MGSHRTTRRTPLTGMGRIDCLDMDTSVFGFLRDELSELAEAPRVNARHRSMLADIFEVFYPNDAVLELVCERDKTVGGGVIQVLNSALLALTPQFRAQSAPTSRSESSREKRSLRTYFTSPPAPTRLHRGSSLRGCAVRQY